MSFQKIKDEFDLQAMQPTGPENGQQKKCNKRLDRNHHKNAHMKYSDVKPDQILSGL